MRPILVPPRTGTAVAPDPPRVLATAPTFAVLICAYQAEATVADAVESALEQTVPAQQVIVVDDGSTDGTRRALMPYEDRIIVHRQENRGAAAASNAGARLASSDFVSILDADDVYDPERIEALSELACRAPDLDILMTDLRFEVAGRPRGRFSERTPFATSEQSLAIFERCFIAAPAIRRATLLAAGGFNESLRIGYDWECWIRLLHLGARAGMVDEPLMRYRIAGDASLTDDRVAALRSRVAVLEAVAHLELTVQERRAWARFLGRRRRRALLAEAEAALRAASPDARRRAFALVNEEGMPARMRLLGLAAALSPGLARRGLARAERQFGASRIRRGLPD